jgi:hypothetical protein
MSTGELVRVSGSRCWPEPVCPFGISASAGRLEEPGVHSTNFSPISDAGRIVQCASEWNGPKPDFWSSNTTAALFCGVTSSESTLPTLAPAIRTSSPETTLAAVSKIARTL